jgi:hypothetical protein
VLPVDEIKEQEIIRRIQLTNVLMGRENIPFKGGRPEREDGKKGFIGDDDITNLLILLNTARTLEEFLYQC